MFSFIIRYERIIEFLLLHKCRCRHHRAIDDMPHLKTVCTNVQKEESNNPSHFSTGKRKHKPRTIWRSTFFPFGMHWHCLNSLHNPQSKIHIDHSHITFSKRTFPTSSRKPNRKRKHFSLKLIFMKWCTRSLCHRRHIIVKRPRVLHESCRRHFYPVSVCRSSHSQFSNRYGTLNIWIISLHFIQQGAQRAHTPAPCIDRWLFVVRCSRMRKGTLVPFSRILICCLVEMHK